MIETFLYTWFAAVILAWSACFWQAARQAGADVSPIIDSDDAEE